MSESFTFEKKKKLAGRIEKLNYKNNKEELLSIKTIIIKHNPELDLTKNNNGYLLFFHNLAPNTYNDLSKFMDKYDKKRLDTEASLANSEELSEGTTKEGNTKNMSKRFRLTNTESHILNRVKYENELKKNETNSDNEVTYFNSDNMSNKKNDNDGIFVKNNSKDSDKDSSKSKGGKAKTTPKTTKKNNK